MLQKSMGWWQERSGRGMCSGGDPFLLKALLRLLHLGGVVKDKPDFLSALQHELAHAVFQRSCSTHVKFQPYLHFETKYRTGTCSNSCTDWDKALQPPAFWRQRQRVVARFSQAAQARHCWPLAGRCNLQPTEAPSAQRHLHLWTWYPVSIPPTETYRHTLQTADKALHRSWLNSCSSVCFEKWGIC